MVSRLYGYIEEARPGAAAGGEIQRMQRLVDCARQIKQHNEAVLQSLPEADKWPPVSRHMYSYPPADDHMITYKGRLLHFAAGLKEVDWNLGDWIGKFEKLLGRLYWERAIVQFEGAYGDRHSFEWRPAKQWVSDRLCQGVLEPITEWERTGDLDASELAQRKSAS